ncbi:hypothetical protein Taro_054113 [Colocasia esculenta]|nr:hypothetical protein [Colocasia esculenta]MQL71265.1 hypothetical protein [Colocasia esculenta]MQM17936.1 hypothetical protein [Colocasia esculenta]MQM21081.1 hypothetical protein [Colocasia esculenta]
MWESMDRGDLRRP